MTTLNLQVGAGADDGLWYTTGYDNVSVQTYIGNPVAAYQTFDRFTNVTIDAGATINTCAMQFQSYSNRSSQVIVMAIDAIAEANATAPTSRADGLGRARTGTPTAWSGTFSWTSDTWYTLPDISAHLQAVIGIGGWAAGNAFAVVLADNGSTTNHFVQGKSYNNSSAVAAKLDITYTAGGGASPVLRLNPIDGLGAKLRGL